MNLFIAEVLELDNYFDFIYFYSMVKLDENKLL